MRRDILKLVIHSLNFMMSIVFFFTFTSKYLLMKYFTHSINSDSQI